MRIARTTLAVILSWSATAVAKDGSSSVDAEQAGDIYAARVVLDGAPSVLQPLVKHMRSALREHGYDLVVLEACDDAIDPNECISARVPRAPLFVIIGASATSDRGAVTFVCGSDASVAREPFALRAVVNEHGPTLRRMQSALLERARTCGVEGTAARLAGELDPGLSLELDGKALTVLDRAVTHLGIYGLREGEHALDARWTNGASRRLAFETHPDLETRLTLKPKRRSAWYSAALMGAGAAAVATGVYLLVDEERERERELLAFPGTEGPVDDGQVVAGVGLVAAGGGAFLAEALTPRHFPWWTAPLSGSLAGGLAALLAAVSL